MIKLLCVSMILIVGCQNNWTSQEQKDFISRCIKYKLYNKTLTICITGINEEVIPAQITCLLLSSISIDHIE